MKLRVRAPFAGVVLAAGSLLLVTTTPLAAYSVTVVQAPGNPDKPDKPDQPATPGKGKKQPDKPRKKPDRRAPAAPGLGRVWAGAGGAVSLFVRAESGSRVVIRERGGAVVTSGTGSQTYRWWTSTGTHRYVVTATDGAGNRSRPSSTVVTADATPPSLTGVQTAVGDRADSRSRLTFSTEPGTAYRVLIDGRTVRGGSDPDARVALFLDVQNGPHRVRVEVRDGVGNLASWNGGFRVRIPRLAVDATLTGDPTDRVQRVSVRATPNARYGVVRVPGERTTRFGFYRGRATVPLRLPDGTYDGVTVTVRDGRGRVGRQKVPDIRVDTTPPQVSLRTDRDAAEQGRLRATVTTDPGSTLEWRLVDGGGDVVTTGELVAESAETTLERDVAEGSFQLEVVATDEFGRATTASAPARIAADPWSDGLTALVVAAVVGAGVVLTGVLTMVLIPLLPRLRRRVRRARARVTARRIERRFARTRPAGLEEKPSVGALNGAVIPRQRSRQAAVATLLQLANDEGAERSSFLLGVSLLPDERVLHATTGQLYETLDADTGDLALEGHDGEVVVTNRRITFVGDVTRDWWTGLVDRMSHVGEERTVLLRRGEDSWAGLVYDDPEVTRLYLELLMAEQQGQREDYLAGLEEELRASQDSAEQRRG
jgi:hypothetical protein